MTADTSYGYLLPQGDPAGRQEKRFFRLAEPFGHFVRTQNFTGHFTQNVNGHSSPPRGLATRKVESHVEINLECLILLPLESQDYRPESRSPSFTAGDGFLLPEC